MNKIDPKVRECFYLGPASNHPRAIITRNVTWAHVRSGRSLITRPTPSVIGEGNVRGHGREASAANGESSSEDGESSAAEA